MRRLSRVLLALTFLASPMLASGEELLLVFPEHNVKMTPEEMAQMEARVRECFPRALDRVVAFIGDERARKTFRKFYVRVLDVDASEPGRYGFSGYQAWQKEGKGLPPRVGLPPMQRGTQSITLHAQPFLTGIRDVENVMTHEMLHVAFEMRMSPNEWADMPDRVVEGISYLGAGEVEQAMETTLNAGKPLLESEAILKSKKARYLKEVSFLFCFEREYGEAARREVVLRLFDGKSYKTAFESVARADWKVIRERCEACLGRYLAERLESAGPFRLVHGAWAAGEYEDVLRLGNELLAEHPGSVWRINTLWDMAAALRALGRHDEALARFEDIRTGRIGTNGRYAQAAREIVETLAEAGRCREASARRAEFTRLYPQFWKHWREDLDRRLARHCPELAPLAPAPAGGAGAR